MHARPFLRLLFALLALTGLSPPRPAGAAPAGSRVLHYVVEPDGRYELTVETPGGKAGAPQRTTTRGLPHLPGHFEALVGPPPAGVRTLEVMIDLPGSAPLFADAAGFAPMRATCPPGRKCYRWRLVVAGKPRREAGAVGDTDSGSRLVLSTFADYREFAAAWSSALPAKALPAAARDVSARPAAGLQDAYARAIALSDRVRASPNDDDGTDQASLLQALLDRADIASTAALVNDGNTYTLPKVPTRSVLNHVIVYVPAFDLYLDPSATPTPAGRLPPALLGKPVLLLRTGTFAMTPLLQPSKVASEDTIAVATWPQGTRAIPMMGAANDAVGAALAAMTRERQHHRDFTCPAVDAEVKTTFRLPAGKRIVALPRAVRLMDGGISFQAGYVRKVDAGGLAIVVTRRLSFRHGRPTCTPAEYRAMQPALERIRRDLLSRTLLAVA
jgi:hypothetical protein